MEYCPDIDADECLKLPEALLPVLEQAAERVHDIWAAGKIADGWRPGKTLDEKAKLHPCLVPYSELAEHDREYDRRTAAAAIRCLLDQGLVALTRD